MRAPMLLHSLAELRELILGCLQVADARSIVEVGAEDGAFTAELLAFVRERHGRLHCIEPEPTSALEDLLAGDDAAVLMSEPSLPALERLEPADAYLIDGDHNHWTVREELRVIGGAHPERAQPCLVILHDIGWPAGRRDQYYAPERLPPEAVRPHTWDKGVTLGDPGVVTGGFGGAGEFAWAEREGGPSNGVLTAVEEVVGERDDLVLVRVPSVFGLGVVYSASADYAERLESFLAPYHASPLLERLEQNRLAMYLRVIELEDELAATLLAVRDVAVESRALWARNAELVQRCEELSAATREVARSRAFRLAEPFSRLKARSGSSPGLSRQRLEELADDRLGHGQA